MVEYIDLYWVVMPAYYKDGPQIHWLDFATLAATVSVCGLVFWSAIPEAQDGAGGRSAFRAVLHFENA